MNSEGQSIGASSVPTRFSDVVPLPDGGIPVVPFLDACQSLEPILSALGETAFAPVRHDVSANIRKVQMKHSTNPESFPTLQSIVLYEKSKQECLVKGSATDAILWLKRAIEFIYEFLKKFVTSTDEDLTADVGHAYSQTLRKYHNYITKGIFNLAVKSVPSRKDFMQNLALRREEDVKDPDFSKKLMADLEQCLNAQDHLIKILSEFYVENSLDSSEQV